MPLASELEQTWGLLLVACSENDVQVEIAALKVGGEVLNGNSFMFIMKYNFDRHALLLILFSTKRGYYQHIR